MAAEALTLLKQLKDGTGNLRKVADGVSKGECTKEFADVLEDVISTLNSVNKDLCIGSSALVGDYDNLLNGSLAQFLSISNQLGGEIAEQAAILQQAFQAQRAFMAVVSECKQPAQAVFMELLKPTSSKLEEVQSYREQRRTSKVFNHLSAVSEGIPMLGWVTVPQKPAPYVKEMVGSAMFYTNRVLKDYREKEPIHVEWTKALVKIIQDLEEYVKTHHLTGVSWNRQGKDASAASVPAPAPPAGGPPAPGPPPPPPPVEAPSGPAAPASGDDSGRAALFADLNRGGDVTKGLKKVTDDMKTHKNPELRKQTKPVSSSPKPYKAPAISKPTAAAAPTKKPPRMELIQKKWDVEYFENNNDVRVEGTEMKQTVYIYKCEKSVVQIPSKVNSITMDSCKKVGLVFDSVLGSIDIVNCQSVKIQVTGKVSIVNIDKTDGCQVYLSEASKDAQIISAKSSEMNVLIPKADGDFTEFPLPEQYRSTYNGKNMTTECVESLG